MKFKISSDRFAEACSVIEYLAMQNGSRQTALSCLPRFLVDKDGEYVVKVTYDEDGDPIEYEGANKTLLDIAAAITPKRLERLLSELMEAAKAIVNPPKGGDLNTPMSTDTKKPPPG